jgi:hypothetical protein
MVSSSYPIMNVHDINSINQIPPTFTRYNSSYNMNNVQPTHKGAELEISKFISVNEQYVIEMHLENLLKQ